MRLFLAILLLAFCAFSVGLIFWQQEYRYSLPAPKPENYREVVVGQTVNYPESILKGPAFIHFYNPDCPCSRFNARHIKELIRNYGDSVELLIVVPSDKDVTRAQKEFGKENHYLADPHQRIAAEYGVYSTPQAVIIDRSGKLFYRGNYNKSRYCTSKATNYAELALVALLNNQKPPVFEEFATVSYGCSLYGQSDSFFNDLIFFK